VSTLELNKYPPTYVCANFHHAPEAVAKCFDEACAVIEFSPAASAIMSRKCLEILLKFQGFNERSLKRNLTSASKNGEDIYSFTLFVEFSRTIQFIGNLAAHPLRSIKEKIFLDIEYEDAEWCLILIRHLIYHYYEMPAEFEQRKMSLTGRLKLHLDRKLPTKIS